MSILPKLRWRTSKELKRQVWPILIEVFGIGMIVGGLWFLNPIISVIVLGIVLVVIAQGIAIGRDNSA
tara:strand:+ start:433 stop:636 length:204 start_codon:yes stop_codon:yes gene_type:complete